jgi:hypothetical protein
MIKKKVLDKNRIRRIDGGFSFIPHRFVLDGFLTALAQKELLLYLFLVLVSDRNGLSFYSYDKICALLELSLDEYMVSRNSLIEKDLIAFDGTFFQVLSLPSKKPKQKQKVVRSPVDRLIRQTTECLRFDR